MRESKFQNEVKKEIRKRFPGCYVLKTDPTDIQGIPDLLILYEDKWAALEVKACRDAAHRPNQDYYVETLGRMSFAAFIFPENKEEVLHAMEESFQRNGSWLTCTVRSE